ncbi:MAG: DNA methylase N-4/N-6 domain-containing protein [bacterium]|nr:MAG: DNA methylase N-4/N-6 domain-containing protein [bacterium]
MPLQQDYLYNGDCRDILPTLPDSSIDLIVTSPPYADQRADSYGGVKPDDYVTYPPLKQWACWVEPTGTRDHD